MHRFYTGPFERAEKLKVGSRSLLRSFPDLPEVPQVPQGNHETSTDIELSLLSSRDTSHRTGISIGALDISPDRSHAVLAGHNILKTIQVSDATCAEDFNLRSAVIAYAAAHKASGTAVTAKRRDPWRANDVKWSHGEYSSTIATAAANGEIVIYDIDRIGVEIARLHGHSRQVQRLGFNPYKGQLLLSGSQDGSARLWDLRDLSREVMSCKSRRMFPGNSDGIREIRWNPRDGMEFAFGTESGILQRWDIRNDKRALLRVSAHESKSCWSIDWHPDGKHLVSAGDDKNIKVWDFSSSDRRKKHIWEIRAPQAVHNVRWRPPCWSSDRQSSSRWQCTQIAASYDQQDPRIHIWDFRRPFVPFLTFDRYETPATDLLWHSEDLLWSVGAAGMFTQIDINFIPRSMDSRGTNNFAIASDGQILYFSQKRERRRESLEDVLEDLHRQRERRGSTGEKLAGTATAQCSSEDSNILNSSSKSRYRPNLTPSRSTRSTRSSAGTTPPPAAPSGPVTALDQSLQAMDQYQAGQISALGYVDGLTDDTAFIYLAKHLPIPEVPPEDTECDLHLRLSDALRASAKVTETLGKYRLSQSFLILALVLERELQRRAERGLQHRLQNPTAAEFDRQSQDQDHGQTSQDEGIDDLVRNMVELATMEVPDAMDSACTEEDAHASKLENPEGIDFAVSSEQPTAHHDDFKDSRLINETVKEKMRVQRLVCSSNYILSDFIPLDEDTESCAWSLACLFNELIDFHLLKLHDAQVPAYLLLHYGRWTNHRFTYERGVQIFSTYHEWLRRHELFIEAAEIRMFAGPEFSELAEYGRHGIVSGGPWCDICDKALKGGNPDFCERCEQPCGICALCENQGPFTSLDAEGHCQRDLTAPTDLWTWCQHCGHGGHISCMTLWWSVECSEGACPTQGCKCDCQPGTRRDDIIRELEKKRGATKEGVITADEWEVPESAAAHRARRLVGAGGSGLTGGGKSALGMTSVERTGNIGKNVKFLIPEEDNEEVKGKGKEKEENVEKQEKEQKEGKGVDESQNTAGGGEHREGSSGFTSYV